jgi:hypothetical protein
MKRLVPLLVIVVLLSSCASRKIVTKTKIVTVCGFVDKDNVECVTDVTQTERK